MDSFVDIASALAKKMASQVLPIVSTAGTAVAGTSYVARRIGDTHDHPGRDAERTDQAHMGSTGALVSISATALQAAYFTIANWHKLSNRQVLVLATTTVLSTIGSALPVSLAFSESNTIGTGAILAGANGITVYTTMAAINKQLEVDQNESQALLSRPIP